MVQKLGMLNLDLVSEVRQADGDSYWEEVEKYYQQVVDYYSTREDEYVEDFLASMESRIKQKKRLTEGQYEFLMKLVLRTM